MSVPGLPSLPELANLGVRRLSAGSAMFQMLWGHLAHLSLRFLTEGDSRIFTSDSMTYGQLQALFGASR
jgi:hypothetical protein